MSMAKYTDVDVARILSAVKFAAEKHRDQRRKGKKASPYVNHPIEVAEALWRVGRVRNVDTVIAAILHDTIEDTETTAAEIEESFGKRVRDLVLDVTDDKSLGKQERKQLQVTNAPHKSRAAKQIKLGDKLCNVRDIAHDPPETWRLRRRREYLDWADEVVAGLRGASPSLEKHYDEVMEEARQLLKSRRQ